MEKFKILEICPGSSISLSPIVSDIFKIFVGSSVLHKITSMSTMLITWKMAIMMQVTANGSHEGKLFLQNEKLSRFPRSSFTFLKNHLIVYPSPEFFTTSITCNENKYWWYFQLWVETKPAGPIYAEEMQLFRIVYKIWSPLPLQSQEQSSWSKFQA